MDIRFLVQLTDGGWRYFTAPKRFCDVLHTPDGYTCQVHLNEGFFHTALPPAIPLNDSGLKGDPFELGYLEGNVPGSGGKVAAVVAAAITLPLIIALVPGRLGQFLRFGLQQFVEGFLYTAPNQFFDLPLDYFLVQLYNLFGHGLLSPFRMVCRDFILPEGCKPCLFIFAKLILPDLSALVSSYLFQKRKTILLQKAMSTAYIPAASMSNTSDRH